MEVSPTEPAARDYFLHVLRTTGKTPVVPIVELMETEDNLGVLIVDGEQTYEVNFATIGRLTGHLRVVDSAGEIIVDKDLAFDLSGAGQE